MQAHTSPSREPPGGVRPQERKKRLCKRDLGGHAPSGAEAQKAQQRAVYVMAAMCKGEGNSTSLMTEEDARDSATSSNDSLTGLSDDELPRVTPRTADNLF
ncbi:hypothetical protein NDU88_005276 [Pleurodeles waltl]|uniref:Uncharacterized protein n=1 Tax=Pleurodeles waltl TaxID=8319 RepID=A0AAV7TAT7_PLEWA|nr:hypothetical protein NDU88_005276 [Pleurodeles waltl]